MTKKLSDLFFSSVRRMARTQRKALKRLTKTARKVTKTATSTGTAKRAATKRAGKAASGGSATVRGTEAGPHGGKGKWQNFVHNTAAVRASAVGRLAYSLYSPEGHALPGLPLVIMLHGCQQTSFDFAAGTGMNALADKKGFMLAYPQQAKRAQALRCWRWFQPDGGHGLAEADAITDLARTLVRRFGLDSNRVYIAGMSAGAGMAALALLRHPDVFASGALHSGAVVGAAGNAAAGLQVMRKASSSDPSRLLTPLMRPAQHAFDRSVMIIHGERDNVVSPRNAAQLAEQFCDLTDAKTVKSTVLAQGTHREYVRQEFLNEKRVMVRLCLLKEVGHAWSGGDERFKFHSSKGPRASLLIWQFFAARGGKHQAE